MQVVEEDGSLLPVAINAAVLALIDAGAPMTAMAVTPPLSFKCALTQLGMGLRLG